jgi:hypothetical protein
MATMAPLTSRLSPRADKKRRRGAIVVLAAIFLVVMLGMIAFAVDLGYIALVKTQLQAAADSAALAAVAASTNATDATAAAQLFANKHTAGGRAIALQSSDVQSGTWDADARVFTATSGLSNAVQVTVRMNDTSGGKTPLFFGRIFGLNSISQQASAIATMNPRDICFVVDLSGSMNDDTQPESDTGAGSSYGAVIQQVFDDFNFGTYNYSRTKYWAGYPVLTSSKGSNWASNLATALKTNATYKNDPRYNTGTTTAATNWVIDVQIGQNLMPNAIPTPNSQVAASYNYWSKYIAWRDTWTSVYNYNDIGYTSYVSYMMYFGRDQKTASGNYTPLSLRSDLVACRTHSESTAGGTFTFPAREMPTHAGRRAIIAALQLIKTRNATMSDPSKRDYVSLISFDRGTDATSGVTIWQPLTSNYDLAMQQCTQLQATADNASSTATATGLIAAYNLLLPQSQGGSGRTSTNKIIVLLTDGKPNLLPTPAIGITSYTGDNYKDAALSQTATIQGKKWYAYAVGIGLGCDTDFMSRMATLGGTTTSHSGTDVENYESDLVSIFQNIITHPKLRLVQ